MMDDFYQKQREREREKIKKIFSAILEEPNPRITEEEFQRDWLQLFMSIPKDDNNPVPILKWVHEVSLSPYRAVDVIRGGRKTFEQGRPTVEGGELLFVVPPLLDSDAIEISQNNHGFFELIMEYKDRAKHHGGEGERFFQSQIEPLFKKSKNARTFQDEMNKIAVGYGYPPIGVNANDGSTAPQTQEQQEVTITRRADF